MASIREYFDADFGYTTKVDIKPAIDRTGIDAKVLFDFTAFTAYISCFVPGTDNGLELFLEVARSLRPGSAEISFAGNVTLPYARQFPGQIQVSNVDPLGVCAKFHGDPDWISSSEIPTSSRLFIYTESTLDDSDIHRLKDSALDLGLRVQFRSPEHAKIRSARKIPWRSFATTAATKKALHGL